MSEKPSAEMYLEMLHDTEKRLMKLYKDRSFTSNLYQRERIQREVEKAEEEAQMCATQFQSYGWTKVMFDRLWYHRTYQHMAVQKESSKPRTWWQKLLG